MGHYTPKRERNASKPRAPQIKATKDDEVHHACRPTPDYNQDVFRLSKLEGIEAPSPKDAHGLLSHVDSLYFCDEKKR